jgi:serine/threonine-protein kinase/endoribonuclease IRE1
MTYIVSRVAVFDILSSPSRPLNHPIALLQPRPLLEQLFSSDPKKLEDLASIPEKTHIGVIGNSLFAMSHLSYPLVTFSEVEKPKRQTIGTGEEGEGVWEEEGCKGLLCFVGTHLSQSAAGTRLSRLIEASADKSFLETSTGSSDKGEAETPTATSTSTDSVPPALPTWTPSLNLVLAHPLTFFGLRKDLAVLLFSSLMGILGVFGLGWKSVKARSKDIALGGVPSGEAYHGLEEIVLKPEPLPQIDIEPIASPISNASPTDQNELSREAEKSFRENGEGESERDDDGEGEAGTGLRKRRRRKRGKGKKGGAGRLNNNNNGDESMMEEEPESLGNGESWMMVEEKEVVPPPTISLPPVAPTVPPTIPLPSSLVVSDSVLGEHVNSKLLERRLLIVLSQDMALMALSSMEDHSKAEQLRSNDFCKISSLSLLEKWSFFKNRTTIPTLSDITIKKTRITFSTSLSNFVRRRSRMFYRDQTHSKRSPRLSTQSEPYRRSQPAFAICTL